MVKPNVFENFTTKKAMTVWIKSIIKEELNSDLRLHKDYNMIVKFVKRHPSMQGHEIEEIKIMKGPNNNGLYKSGSCIWVKLGKEFESISYKNCVTPYTETKERQIKKLKEFFRLTISSEMKEFKDYKFENGNGYCEITGHPLEYSNAEVDHVIKFCLIFKNYIEENGITKIIEQYKTDKGRSSLAKHWLEYHNEVCELRLLSKQLNRLLN